MIIIQTRLRNKMENTFLTHNIIIYIGKNMTENLSFDLVIDKFNNLK